MSTLLRLWAQPAALLCIANLAATWSNFVDQNVPEPYLDEFFHVPQAQKYCRNDYTWDPKITTPPGLYLVSLFLEKIIGCDTYALRKLNLGAICLICLILYQILQYLHSSTSTVSTNKQQSSPENITEDRLSMLHAITALNISLFPPLFFFSGLYYTDVMSTLMVLATYYSFLKQRSTDSGFLGALITVVLGIVALLFRQTNIFWVAVFPAGLAIVDTLKGNSAVEPFIEDSENILERSWNDGRIYDVSVDDAGPTDYVLFLISLALVAIKKPLTVIKTLVPYGVLLLLFGGFVIWNEGVVLGDKSAHVATIHVPQMLYIWPYIIFFSLPLTLSTLVKPLIPFAPARLQSFCRRYITGTSKSTSPNLLSAALFNIIGLVAVHFNTIIHPYTLADNRHYVFYVFRILIRHPALKYLAVPLYYICALLAIRTLGTPSPTEYPSKRPAKSLTRRLNGPQSNQISFVVVWAAATALSVITAPLVEPRYFIIPWVIWRLHVPTVHSASSSEDATKEQGSFDVRLLLETLWHLLINLMIGYNFLYRGFSWASEPGNVQRFLW